MRHWPLIYPTRYHESCASVHHLHGGGQVQQNGTLHPTHKTHELLSLHVIWLMASPRTWCLMGPAVYLHLLEGVLCTPGSCSQAVLLFPNRVQQSNRKKKIRKWKLPCAARSPKILDLGLRSCSDNDTSIRKCCRYQQKCWYRYQRVHQSVHQTDTMPRYLLAVRKGTQLLSSWLS